MRFTQKFKMAAKNSRNIIYGKCRLTLLTPHRLKNFDKIILSCTVPEINALCVLHRNSRWLPKMAGKRFWTKSPVNSGDTPAIKYFNEIAQSRIVSEINAFLHFTQKFKMATKNGGKMIFGKDLQLTLLVPYLSKLSTKSLYLAPFPR